MRRRPSGNRGTARRSLTWLAVLLLVGNILAAGAMPGEKTGAVLADPSLAYMAVPDGHGALAMADGPEMAQTDHCAGSHSSFPASHHDKIFCALCLPLVQTGTAMLAPPAPVLAIVLPPAKSLPPARSDTAASRPAYTLPPPRAPPAA